MKSIHQNRLKTAEEYSETSDYMVGANIAKFVKVVCAMLDQDLV